jgi:hypothetical protein
VSLSCWIGTSAVSVRIPDFMDGVQKDLDAPIERFRHTLADSGFTLLEGLNKRVWQEGYLYERERGILVVPEALGTASYFLAGDERLGVHPMLRLLPPSELANLEPRQILVGHGEGITENAPDALQTAIRGSRTRTPALVVKQVGSVLPF